MLKRIVFLLIGFPIAIFLITLAVANRHGVSLVLDPFRPENPLLSIELPFYAYLFSALVLGVVVGGLAVWFGQGRWRRTARQRTQEARRWQSEADRLTREREANLATGSSQPKQFAAISGH